MPNTPEPQTRGGGDMSPSPAPVEKAKPKIQTVSNLPDSVIKQGKYVMRDGRKVLVLPPNVMQQYRESLNKPQPEQQETQQQQQDSLLLSSSTTATPSLNSLPQPPEKLLSPTAAGPEADKFELTDDYIQQTIKEALQSGNLTPDLEEKLMNQLDPELSKVVGNKPSASVQQPPSAVNRVGKKSKAGKGATAAASMDSMDEDWTMQSSSAFGGVKSSRMVVGGRKEAGGGANSLVAERKVSYSVNRLSSILFKHKEQLKKEIAKKRNLLEKELSTEIQKVGFGVLYTKVCKL